MKIAEMEEKHVNFWQNFLQKKGYRVSAVKPNKTKVILCFLEF